MKENKLQVWRNSFFLDWKEISNLIINSFKLFQFDLVDFFQDWYKFVDRIIILKKQY